MHRDNNPVIFNQKKSSLEIEEKKENLFLNIVAKRQLRKLIKENKTGTLYIQKSFKDMYFVRK